MLRYTCRTNGINRELQKCLVR